MEIKKTNNNLHVEDVIDDIETDSHAMIKMKLRTFCPDKGIHTKINSIVFDVNRLVAEAYEFANFHLLMVISNQRMNNMNVCAPKIDRNFYYRCLLAVSINNCRNGTLGNDFNESIIAFDNLREGDAQHKIDIRSMNPIVADQSITMATMATNHLWLNIYNRITRFISWKYPILGPKWRKRIADAILKTPTIALTILFKNDTSHQAQLSMSICKTMRSLLPLQSSKTYASRAHFTIPLYEYILSETEASKRAFEVDGLGMRVKLLVKDNSVGIRLTKFRGRTFTLLPSKNGLTISYVAFSDMTMMGILKSMKKEDFKGDGRSVDRLSLWRKHFNVKMVETKTREFDCRISTDGCGVSIQFKKKSSILFPSPPIIMEHPEPTSTDLKTLQDILSQVGDPKIDIRSVDPGFTDVATIASIKGTVEHYSSAKYYETAFYNLSRKKTEKWNKEKMDEVKSIKARDTCQVETFKTNIKTYIELLPSLLRHRMDKNYRGMRFQRYIGKQKAIQEISDLIAPPNKTTIIGFGNWNGGNGTPIKRRCAGPLQEIKFELHKRKNVFLEMIHERNTSQVCSCCYEKLTNMRSETKNGVKKVHKVLHCKSNQTLKPELRAQRCGTTWNRDVNASKNILELLLHMINGSKRPSVFMMPLKFR